MKIQILGPGCAKCTRLMATPENAAKALGLYKKKKKISDINQIMSFGVMMTPGLVVDGEVKSVGKVPPVEEMKKLLQQASK